MTLGETIIKAFRKMINNLKGFELAAEEKTLNLTSVISMLRELNDTPLHGFIKPYGSLRLIKGKKAKEILHLLYKEFNTGYLKVIHQVFVKNGVKKHYLNLKDDSGFKNVCKKAKIKYTQQT